MNGFNGIGNAGSALPCIALHFLLSLILGSCMFGWTLERATATATLDYCHMCPLPPLNNLLPALVLETRATIDPGGLGYSIRVTRFLLPP